MQSVSRPDLPDNPDDGRAACHVTFDLSALAAFRDVKQPHVLSAGF